MDWVFSFEGRNQNQDFDLYGFGFLGFWEYEFPAEIHLYGFGFWVFGNMNFLRKFIYMDRVFCNLK